MFIVTEYAALNVTYICMGRAINANELQRND